MILPEWTISDLQEKMESGELTARRLAELYLERISEVDKNGPYINSVIEINPDALEIADALDAEHKAGKTRGAQESRTQAATSRRDGAWIAEEEGQEGR